MRVPRLILAVVLASALLPVPAVAEEAPPSWLGVTFEQPAAELRATLGDPVLLTRFPEALAQAAVAVPAGVTPQRKARYPLSLEDPLFLIVSERRGIVVGIEAFSDRPLTAESMSVPPDPSGVRLGATEARRLPA